MCTQRSRERLRHIRARRHHWSAVVCWAPGVAPLPPGRPRSAVASLVPFVPTRWAFSCTALNERHCLTLETLEFTRRSAFFWKVTPRRLSHSLNVRHKKRDIQPADAQKHVTSAERQVITFQAKTCLSRLYKTFLCLDRGYTSRFHGRANMADRFLKTTLPKHLTHSTLNGT